MKLTEQNIYKRLSCLVFVLYFSFLAIASNRLTYDPIQFYKASVSSAVAFDNSILSTNILEINQTIRSFNSVAKLDYSQLFRFYFQSKKLIEKLMSHIEKRYFDNSNFLPISIANYDIIFPFHYFW